MKPVTKARFRSWPLVQDIGVTVIFFDLVPSVLASAPLNAVAKRKSSVYESGRRSGAGSNTSSPKPKSSLSAGAATKLTREPDILRSFCKHLGQQFASGAQRFFAYIFALQEEQIEDVIDQRDISRAFKILEKLERRTPFLVQCSDFAIEDSAADWQLLHGVKQLRVIKRLLIARDQADVFAVFEGQGSVAVELDFVDPIAFGQLFDGQGLHLGDETWAASGGGLHGSFQDQAESRGPIAEANTLKW